MRDFKNFPPSVRDEIKQMIDDEFRQEEINLARTCLGLFCGAVIVLPIVLLSL